jgi:flagellar basal-body rod protein FlgB
VFERIELIGMARALGRHVAERQIIVARNIANADTPAYRARDLEPFEDSYQRQSLGPMRVTNDGHLDTPDWSPTASKIVTQDSGVAPNGNSVSLEEEMLKAAELKRGHDLSLAITRSALGLMRTSIGRA